MLILGDVFAVIASLVGVFLTSYAMILGLGLLFGGKARLAMDGLVSSPWKAVGLGVGVGIPSLVVALTLSAIANPLAKVLGFVVLVTFLTLSMLGATGIAWLMAARLRALDPAIPVSVAVSRSVMLLVGAGLFPFVGWFLFAPLTILVGFGIGVRALFARASVLAPE